MMIFIFLYFQLSWKMNSDEEVKLPILKRT